MNIYRVKHDGESTLVFADGVTIGPVSIGFYTAGNIVASFPTGETAFTFEGIEEALYEPEEESEHATPSKYECPGCQLARAIGIMK